MVLAVWKSADFNIQVMRGSFLDTSPVCNRLVSCVICNLGSLLLSVTRRELHSLCPLPMATMIALFPFCLLGDAQEETPSGASSTHPFCREVAAAGWPAEGWLRTIYSMEHADVWEVFAAQTDISYSL